MNSMLCSLEGWFVVSRIYVALAIFQPYRNLEGGDNKTLKSYQRERKSNHGPLAPQAKSLTTTPPSEGNNRNGFNGSSYP